MEESSKRGDYHKHGGIKHLSSVAVPSFNLRSVVSHMIGMMMMSAVRTPNLAYSMVLDFHGTFHFILYSGLKCSLWIDYVLLVSVSTTEVVQL